MPKVFLRVFKVGIPEVDKLIEEHGYDDLAPNNGINARAIEDENKDDRISKLPDDILQFLISLLTMREGAATAILSRRWRNLWSRSVSCLDFNDSNLFGYEFPKNIISMKEKEFENEERGKIRIHGIPKYPRRFRRKAEKFIESQRAKFIRRINRILKLRRASTIDKFKVSFLLGNESASHVDRWMKLAAAEGVTKLELDFNRSKFWDLGRISSNRYEFPVEGFGSSLKYLRLRFCVLDFPPCFRGLKSLISLHLHNSYITSNDVQNILSNCRSLEWLSLRDCHFPYNTSLKIVGPSILLKHLGIVGCYFAEEIELHDVNLLSFEYVTRIFSEIEYKLLIKNAPHLSRLVLRTHGGLVEILGNVCRLETLFLKHVDRKTYKLPNLSALANLKRLVFSADDYLSNLFHVVYLLKTFPLLQQLELDMGTFFRYTMEPREESRNISTMPGCPHNNLNEVVIYAFENNPEQVELAKYLLKNAVVLEKMKIHTACKRYCHGGIWFLSENGKRVGNTLKKVYKMLEKEARPSTKLQFLAT